MPSAAEEPLVRLYRGEPADLAPWAESQEPEHYQNCLRAISSRDEAALNDALEARFRSAGNTSPHVHRYMRRGRRQNRGPIWAPLQAGGY